MSNTPYKSGPANMLAAVPSLLRRRPVDTIIVIPYNDHDAIQAFHSPLPEPGDRVAYERIANTIIESVAADADTDAILIAVFTDRIAGGLSDRPFDDLQNVVARKAHDHGIHLVESYYVAKNGWGSFCCNDPACDFAGPMPISELIDRAEALDLEF